MRHLHLHLQRALSSGKVSLTRDAVEPGQAALLKALLGTPTAQVSLSCLLVASNTLLGWSTVQMLFLQWSTCTHWQASCAPFT